MVPLSNHPQKQVRSSLSIWMEKEDTATGAEQKAFTPAR